MKSVAKQRIIPAFKQFDLEGPKPRVNEFLFALQIFVEFLLLSANLENILYYYWILPIIYIIFGIAYQLFKKRNRFRYFEMLKTKILPSLFKLVTNVLERNLKNSSFENIVSEKK